MNHGNENHKPLGVAVITPLGPFPNDDDYRRAYEGERIQSVLDLVKEAQHLTDTSDWVVKVDGRTLDPNKTFSEEHLSCVVEIEWHKAEGGGGS